MFFVGLHGMLWVWTGKTSGFRSFKNYGGIVKQAF